MILIIASHHLQQLFWTVKSCKLFPCFDKIDGFLWSRLAIDPILREMIAAILRCQTGSVLHRHAFSARIRLIARRDPGSVRQKTISKSPCIDQAESLYFQFEFDSIWYERASTIGRCRCASQMSNWSDATKSMLHRVTRLNVAWPLNRPMRAQLFSYLFHRQ